MPSTAERHPLPKHRPQYTVTHLMTTCVIVAAAMSFPFAAFWILEILTLVLLGAASICVVWLLAEGDVPYPRPIRLLAMVSEHLLPTIAVVWIASMLCTIRYSDSHDRSVVIGEHAVGLLRSSKPIAQTGWNASWSGFTKVRTTYSAGWSGGINWESHHYQPLFLPVLVAMALLTLCHSTTTQTLIRNVAKRHNKAVNPSRR